MTDYDICKQCTNNYKDHALFSIDALGTTLCANHEGGKKSQAGSNPLYVTGHLDFKAGFYHACNYVKPIIVVDGVAKLRLLGDIADTIESVVRRECAAKPLKETDTQRFNDNKSEE